MIGDSPPVRYQRAVVPACMSASNGLSARSAEHGAGPAADATETARYKSIEHGSEKLAGPRCLAR